LTEPDKSQILRVTHSTHNSGTFVQETIMSFGSIPFNTPPASVHGHSSTSNFDAQLASLMEDYLHATQLQNSLKKRIKQLLKEREVEARRKEDEAREALRRAEEERQTAESASILMKEKMKQAEMMDDDEEDEVMEKGKVIPPFATSSPAAITRSGIEMEIRRKEDDEVNKIRHAVADAAVYIRVMQKVSQERWHQEEARRQKEEEEAGRRRHTEAKAKGEARKRYWEVVRQLDTTGNTARVRLLYPISYTQSEYRIESVRF
jgi:hypothetical protein